MKNMSKKLLSMALVIAMVLSLMPMSFAAEGEKSGITVKYDISENADSTNKSTFTNSYNDETTNGFFSYAADYNSDAAKNYRVKWGGTGAIELYTGSWIIFKINVPVAGTYDVKINNRVNAKGQLLNAYIFSTTVTPNASALSDGNFIGTVDCNNVTGINGQTTPVSFMKDGVAASYNFTSAGEYYIAFQSADEAVSNTDTTTAYVGNIVLNGGDGSALMGGKISGVADELQIGDTATATATAFLSKDGSAAGNFTYSSDSSAITIDSETGALTANAKGSATITATSADALSGCNTITKTIKVTAPRSDITVEYDIMGHSDTSKDIKFANLLNYETTNGFLNYAADSRNDGTKNYYMRYNAYTVIEIYTNQWMIFKINVPKAGEYDIKVKNHASTKGQLLNAYIFPTTVTPDKDAFTNPATTFIGTVDCNNVTGTDGKIIPNSFMKDGVAASYNFTSAGEYYIAFQSASAGATGTEYAYVGNIVLNGGDGSALMGGTISGVEDELEIGESATATATAFLSQDGSAAGNFTYSSDSSAISIDENTGALTADEAGTATITATSADALSGCNTITKTVTVKAAEPGEAVEDTMVSFTFVTSDEAAGSVSANGYPIVGAVAIGTSVEATATANDGYEFAYWRNGAGTVLSTNATATFKFNTNTGVYAEFIKLPAADASEVPVYFYNGNGALLDNKNVTKGTTFGDAKIANPRLTGFAFKHWSDKDEEIAIANDTAINSILHAVAIFENKAGESFTVKVDGITKATDKKYGDSVTVYGSENFKAWKLGDNVVSYEKNYTFFVWGDIELTEATEGEAAPVAVLEEVDENPMLIYSVPSDCELLEAGILFGDGARIDSYESKAFAKEGTGQFTAQPNGEEDNKTARGYLMFKKDGVIRVIYAD